MHSDTVKEQEINFQLSWVHVHADTVMEQEFNFKHCWVASFFGSTNALLALIYILNSKVQSALNKINRLECTVELKSTLLITNNEINGFSTFTHLHCALRAHTEVS